MPPLRAIDRFHDAGSAGDECPPDVLVRAAPLLPGEQSLELRPVIRGDLEGSVNMAGEQRTLYNAQRGCLAGAILGEVEPSPNQVALDQHVRFDEQTMKRGDGLHEMSVIGFKSNGVSIFLIRNEVKPV